MFKRLLGSSRIEYDSPVSDPKLRTNTAKDEVEDVEVLGPEDVSVLALVIRVAVHDGSASGREQ